MIERFFHEPRESDSRGRERWPGGRGGHGRVVLWVDEAAKVRSPRFHRCVGYKRLLGYPAREATGQYLASAAGLPPHELERHRWRVALHLSHQPPPTLPRASSHRDTIHVHSSPPSTAATDVFLPFFLPPSSPPPFPSFLPSFRADDHDRAANLSSVSLTLSAPRHLPGTPPRGGGRADRVFP